MLQLYELLLGVSIHLRYLTLQAFQNLPILDQVIIVVRQRAPYRNMQFESADFASFTNRILKNAGIQKTVNATEPFSMESLYISGFEGQEFLNICWSYIQG